MDKTKKLEILQKLISLANNNPNENEANSAARRVCKLIVELNINFKVRSASDKVPPPRPSQQQAPWNYSRPDNPDWYEDLFNATFGGRKTSQQYNQEAKRRGEEARKRAEQEAYDKQREVEKEAARKAEEDYRRQQTNYNSNKWYYQRPPQEAHIDVDPPKEEKTIWDMIDIDNMSIQELKQFKNRKDIYFDPVTATYRKASNPPKGHWSDIPFDFNFREGTFGNRPSSSAQSKDRPQKEKRPLNCTGCGKEFMTAYVGNLFVCHECHWKNYEEKRKAQEAK